VDVKLMTKDQYLGFQRGPRPEQSDLQQPDQAASFSHKAEALRDSALVASRIRFPAGQVILEHAATSMLPLSPIQPPPCQLHQDGGRGRGYSDTSSSIRRSTGANSASAATLVVRLILLFCMEALILTFGHLFVHVLLFVLLALLFVRHF